MCFVFGYELGSLIAATGKVDSDISRMLAQASKAFGALRKAVFMGKNLHVCLFNKKENLHCYMVQSAGPF